MLVGFSSNRCCFWKHGCNCHSCVLCTNSEGLQNAPCHPRASTMCILKALADAAKHTRKTVTPMVPKVTSVAAETDEHVSATRWTYVLHHLTPRRDVCDTAPVISRRQVSHRIPLSLALPILPSPAHNKPTYGAACVKLGCIASDSTGQIVESAPGPGHVHEGGPSTDLFSPKLRGTTPLLSNHTHYDKHHAAEKVHHGPQPLRAPHMDCKPPYPFHSGHNPMPDLRSPSATNAPTASNHPGELLGDHFHARMHTKQAAALDTPAFPTKKGAIPKNQRLSLSLRAGHSTAAKQLPCCV